MTMAKIYIPFRELLTMCFIIVTPQSLRCTFMVLFRDIVCVDLMIMMFNGVFRFVSV